MDNGLIFPYPLTRANAEASDTNHGEACRGRPSGRLAGGWWDLDW